MMMYEWSYICDIERDHRRVTDASCASGSCEQQKMKKEYLLRVIEPVWIWLAAPLKRKWAWAGLISTLKNITVEEKNYTFQWTSFLTVCTSVDVIAAFTHVSSINEKLLKLALRYCFETADRPEFLQPYKSNKSKEQIGELPMMLYIPGIDGTGLAASRQFPTLAEAFDLRALSIPAEDRSTFQQLVTRIM